MATTTKKRTAAPRPRKAASAALAAVKEARPKKSRLSTEEDAGWLTAVRAAEEKKAEGIQLLDLRNVTTFTDYLIICSGSNPRQNQAIADEVERELKKAGERPQAVEGYQNAEWILMDYGYFVVNIFSAKARTYYDLERLWRDATQVEVQAAAQ